MGEFGVFFRVRGWRDHDLNPRNFPSLLAWLLGTLHSHSLWSSFPNCFQSSKHLYSLEGQKVLLVNKKEFNEKQKYDLSSCPHLLGLPLLSMPPTYSLRHGSACILHLENNYENQITCSCPHYRKPFDLLLNCGFQRVRFFYHLN